jgi:F0F1-type ATP synthase assembly protein I
MRIGKPLLIATTALGLPIGIYEGFHLAGMLGFMMVALIALFGAGIVWIVSKARAEAQAERSGAES